MADGNCNDLFLPDAILCPGFLATASSKTPTLPLHLMNLAVQRAESHAKVEEKMLFTFFTVEVALAALKSRAMSVLELMTDTDVEEARETLEEWVNSPLLDAVQSNLSTLLNSASSSYRIVHPTTMSVRDKELDACKSELAGVPSNLAEKEIQCVRAMSQMEIWRSTLSDSIGANGKLREERGNAKKAVELLNSLVERFHSEGQAKQSTTMHLEQDVVVVRGGTVEFVPKLNVYLF
ncbi:hypothetical protein HDU93_000256 [Gonapodya sp. JEL0774]|nr:hypothetical protein HDU93_000256 [Gonapodya sp. JEL0774]